MSKPALNSTNAEPVRNDRSADAASALACADACSKSALQAAERRIHPLLVHALCRVDLAPPQEVELHVERVAVVAKCRRNAT